MKGSVMKKFLFFLLLLLPTMAQAKILDLNTFTLSNGLMVAVIENHKAPIALQMLFYKTGSINDPKGKGGIAHLLEHLMFRGTKNVPDQSFNSLTDLHGIANNAYTTYNVTAYHELADISKLELMMALEADRMHNLTISDEAFNKEREVVLQERYQRFETQPAPLFYESLNALLWQNQPRANPVSGAVDDIKALQKKDAENFYQHWYAPNNALLVIAGDISLADVRPLVEKYYGHIKPATIKPMPKLSTEIRPMSMSIRSKLEGVTQPRFCSYIRIEPDTLTLKDEMALSVLATYLADDDTSFLYQQLVYQNKKFLSADISFSYDNPMGGTFAFYTIPADKNLTAADIQNIYDKTLNDALKALNNETIEKIKNHILSDTVYLSENPSDSAQFVGGLLLKGYSAEEIIHYDEALKQISLDDVRRAWAKVQQSKVRINGYLE